MRERIQAVTNCRLLQKITSRILVTRTLQIPLRLERASCSMFMSLHEWCIPILTLHPFPALFTRRYRSNIGDHLLPTSRSSWQGAWESIFRVTASISESSLSLKTAVDISNWLENVKRALGNFATQTMHV